MAPRSHLLGLRRTALLGKIGLLMKRDYNLVRIILRDMEEAEPMQSFQGFAYDGYQEAVIREHIELLLDAGLLAGEVHRSGDNSIADRLASDVGRTRFSRRDEGREHLAKSAGFSP